MSSDDEYEDLCAEIYHENQFIAILSQEEGFENLKIEFFSSKTDESWVFNFKELEQALMSAKETLQIMKKWLLV